MLLGGGTTPDVAAQKPFDLLHLVEHAGELVRKETLLEAVWPDTVRADGVLTTSMGELRKVLGETARQPQYIATVHRRGYRFIAPVTPVDTPKASAMRDASSIPRSPSSPYPPRLWPNWRCARGPGDRACLAAPVFEVPATRATARGLCHG